MGRGIERRLAKLDALEAGGVDNWDFYDESLSDWRKENHVDECIDKAIDSINDIMTSADVSEPAGPRCGYSIDFDSADMEKVLLELIKEVNNT